MRTRLKLNKFLGILLAVTMVFTSFLVVPKTTLAVTNPDTVAATENGLMNDVQDGVILHCWDWSFNNIKDQMAEIAAAGYTAIQTSPIQAAKESTLGKGNDMWWIFYQPKSFEIDNSEQSALGTKAEFEAMCDEAHKYGIKVIVDVVANHLGNQGNYTISNAIDADIRTDSDCWHDQWNQEINYDDRYSITHGSMGGLPDLNTENPKIQNYVLNFLKECIDSGADGFRFDAAKHISVSAEGTQYTFWENTLEVAKVYAKESRGIDLYAYGEILHGTDGPAITAYTKYMSVTDNQTGNSARENVVNGNAAGAASYYYYKETSADKLVLWAESHDTYSNDSYESTYVSIENINKTWALVGSRADATALYFARTDGYREGKIGEIGTWDWKNDEVVAVNQFHNFFNGQSEYLSSSGSIAYNERGTSGVVLVNCNGTNATVSVQAHKMVDGVYKDQITGNTFTVSNGYINGNIGSTGIAVVYNETVEPAATISVPGGTFSSTTLTLTFGLSNATSGTYKIGDAKAVKFTSDKTVIIGTDMNIGDSVDVVLTATDGSSTTSATYTFTKIAKSTNVAYLKLPSGWSDTVYCYVYDSETGDTNADFPGVLMSYDASTGYYKYDIPTSFTNPRVIFYNSTTNRYPADYQEGLACIGKKLCVDNTWMDYESPFEPVYENGVYFDNTYDWSNVYVYLWNSTGSFSQWHGTLMTKLPNGYYGLDLGDFVPEKVIFNNGSTQTGDLTFTANGLYTSTGLQAVIHSEAPTISGLNKAEDGRWYYYTDGEIDPTYTGMAKNAYGWWYMNNGRIDTTYTGMAKNDYGWWYFNNGSIDTTYTGMAKNDYGWWYFKNGRIDTTYTGMAKNDYGWWYFANGKINTKFTGIAQNDYGMWYFTNGRINTKFTGNVTYNDITYRVVKGQVKN